MTPEEEQKNLWGDKFADLLSSADSHYQFLGVPPEADLEEIKAAYRPLSKEYHPDTTSLPLIDALKKFMKLREVYDTLSNDETQRFYDWTLAQEADTLSNDETQRFYDWTLAQEAASREAEKMKVKFEDPYMKELENFESVPDMVDRLGG